VLRIIVATVAMSIIWAAPAQAYLDPGVGSMFLQALAGGAIMVGLFWNRIKQGLKRLFRVGSSKPQEAIVTENHDKENGAPQ